MKRNLIALSVAAAFAAPAAHALTPTQLTTLFSADPTSVDQLWISGATAPTAAVRGAVTKLCVDADANGVADDLHILGDTAGVSTKRVSAYACTLTSTGKPTIVYHTHNGGSFEAYTPHLIVGGEVNPFIGSTVMAMKDIAGGLATCTTTDAVSPYNYVGCGQKTNLVLAANTSVNHYPTLPRGGFSDTEYVLNQINLNVALGLGDIGTESPTGVGQGFGLGASYKLYRDLQTDQFGATSACVSGFSVASPNLTEACKPSVPAYKYMLVTNAGTAASKDASLFNKNWPTAGTIAATSALSVERRVGTSGTQSTSAQFFLNAPCGTGQPGGALTAAGGNASGSTVLGVVTVRSNSGSGDVASALNSTAAYKLGVLSLENTPATSWNWVKIDGVSPTDDTGADALNISKNRATSLNGSYKFWNELVGFVPASDSGEGAALISGIIGAWSDPALTNLKGIFPTVLTGATGATVSEWVKNGVACSQPTR